MKKKYLLKQIERLQAEVSIYKAILLTEFWGLIIALLVVFVYAVRRL